MIEFTIKGNHENPNGNPLPKHRKTFRQQHTPEARRYHEYLDYVRGCFLDAIEKRGTIKAKDRWVLDHLSFVGRKPFDTGDRKCRMEIFITWGSHAHGDPENIFGAIADAIFEQDKHLAGSFDFDPEPRAGGKVSVRIIVGEDRCGVHPGKRLKVAG